MNFRVKVIERTISAHVFERLINEALDEINEKWARTGSSLVDIKYQFQDGHYSALIIYKT